MTDPVDPARSDLLKVASRVVWFKPPDAALEDRVLFLNHVMTWGDVEDIAVTRRHFDDDAFRHALQHAHPGVFDPRSWAYWHAVLGVGTPPGLPVRRLPATSSPSRRKE